MVRTDRYGAPVNALARLPRWATTGVGSLPHTSVEEAVAHVAASYDVPFCPQLPRLEGDMIAEWLGADPRRCGWSPEPDVLSFDLALARPDERVLARLVARGGRVAWGVVQPHKAEHALDALTRIRAEAAGGSHSLLTPSCGSGRMSLPREHELATALRETAQALRAA
jgi:hypothetical protein